MLPQPPRMYSCGRLSSCCPRPWLLFSHGPPPLPPAMVVVQPWSFTAAPGHGCCSAMVPHCCPRPWLLFSHGLQPLPLAMVVVPPWSLTASHPLPVICVVQALFVLRDWNVTPHIDMSSETFQHLSCPLGLLWLQGRAGCDLPSNSFQWKRNPWGWHLGGCCQGLH